MVEQPPPVVIEPFSRFGDEVAGDTPDDVALNLMACTRLDLTLRCKPRRPLPDLHAAFQGCTLTEEAKRALRFVHGVYAEFRRKRPDAQPQPQEMELALPL